MGLLEWGGALVLRNWLNKVIDKGGATNEAIVNLITDEIISMATNPHVVADVRPADFEPRQQTVSPLSIGTMGDGLG
mgnify:CR=1 FL=1